MLCSCNGSTHYTLELDPDLDPPYHSQNTLISSIAQCSSRHLFTHTAYVGSYSVKHINRSLDKLGALPELGLDGLQRIQSAFIKKKISISEVRTAFYLDF